MRCWQLISNRMIARHVTWRWLAAEYPREDAESGNVMLLVALSMVALCGFAALVLDVGVLYEQKQQMQNGADAGALAGADVLLTGASAAANTAYEQAAGNDQLATYTAVADTSANTVTVTGKQTVPLTFARLLGFSSVTIQVKSVAEIGTLTSGTGIVPIAVPQQTFQFGQTVDLTEGAGDGSSGNYGFLDFSGNGASGVLRDIQYGYQGTLQVGQQVFTEPGHMTGPVDDAINYRMQASSTSACNSFATATSGCSRVMILPVVNTLDGNGKHAVAIVGFAAFYLDGLVGNGGHQQIEGRFLRIVLPGSVGSGTDDGTYSVRLSN